jgi:hypothetical protein
MSAQSTLDRADLYPVFDDMDLTCRATRAANAVIATLDNRGGFDGWFGDIDDENKVEIVEELAQVIELVYPKPREFTQDEIMAIADRAAESVFQDFERRLQQPVIDYGKVQGYVSDIREATRNLTNPQGNKAMSESKKATALEAVNSLADALFKDHTREGGIITLPKDIGDTTLPEGITVESRALHQDHPVMLVAATAEGLGRIGIEAFKADDKLEQLSVEFGYGSDSVAGTIQRSKEYPAGGIPKEGEERDPNAVITKYGIVSMKYGVNAHANKGVLKKVRDSINERAKAALAG